MDMVYPGAGKFDMLPEDSHGRFEEGTLNYMGVPAISIGLQHLESVGMGTINRRVAQLADWLINQLVLLHHPSGDRSVLPMFCSCPADPCTAAESGKVAHSGEAAAFSSLLEEAQTLNPEPLTLKLCLPASLDLRPVGHLHHKNAHSHPRPWQSTCPHCY